MAFLFRRIFSGCLLVAGISKLAGLRRLILPQWVSVTIMLALLQWCIAEIVGMPWVIGFLAGLMQAYL